MPSQRRGQNTKNRILEEAREVFAERGYRDATHAEICARAGTNVASINYYFESKEELYRAVFKHLIDKAERLYPLHGNLPPTATPQQRLEALVRALLSRMFDTEPFAVLHKIRMTEFFNPTGLLKEVLSRRLARDRQYTIRVLRELIGPRASQRDVEWCEMSIISQCMIAAPGPREDGPRAIFGLTAENLDQLIEHIIVFSLAGIDAIKRKKKTAGKSSPTAAAGK
jgi:AcrR family transcriptional regulator